ncbi:hypothetical protein QBC43DRAFT_286427 [Cladorrhinum sp. PSN259]|nr:hypothetical protein QBC43DRAFT_286427 [Cladorrhinum sp. PSN259]
MHPTQQSAIPIPELQSDDSDFAYASTPTEASPEQQIQVLDEDTEQTLYLTGTVQGKKVYYCGQSNCKRPRKAYKQLCQLTKHQRSHLKPVKCHLCDERFSQQKDLARHLKKHHPDHPTVFNNPKVRKQFIKCDWCGQAGRYDNIKRHVRAKHPEMKDANGWS